MDEWMDKKKKLNDGWVERLTDGWMGRWMTD